ncbi:hypothetical protein RJ641_023300 [Dillenia turbinata]|uniref:Uncharacterized protein n=1 Tax=Dillenia turbinata TaxID=194707 RepID=A0AAN8YSM2_9MAGN
MSTYFGNVLSIPFGEKIVGELKDNSLSWVADAIHDCLEAAVNKEHFLGLIDWVEAHRPEPSLAKIYCSGTEYRPGFVVSSGQRFPVSKKQLEVMETRAAKVFRPLAFAYLV